MTKTLGVIALFALAVLPAYARLGETEDQCIARYGAVVKQDQITSYGLSLPALGFVKNGYIIMVAFLSNKAGMIEISKQDGSDISENEITNFLDANSGGQKWNKQNAFSVDSNWMREDGAKAQYDPFQKNLTLATKEFEAAMEAAKKADEDKKTQGF